jgi:hypothetical protein
VRLDGNYTFTIKSLPPAVLSLDVTQMAIGIVPSPLGPPSTTLQPAFVPGQLVPTYTVIVPYVYYSLKFQLDFINTAGAIYSTSVWIHFNQGAFLATKIGLTAPYLLTPTVLGAVTPLWNEFVFMSNGDGNYTIDVTRNPPDVTAVRMFGHSFNFPDELIDFQSRFNFQPGQLAYNFNCTYIIESVQLRANFTTAGSLWLDKVIGVDNNSRQSIQLTSKAWTGFFNLSVGINIIRLRTPLDGNYTFTIKSLPPAVLSLDVTQMAIAFASRPAIDDVAACLRPRSTRSDVHGHRAVRVLFFQVPIGFHRHTRRDLLHLRVDSFQSGRILRNEEWSHGAVSTHADGARCRHATVESICIHEQR